MALDIRFVETLVFDVEVWASQPQQIPIKNVYIEARIRLPAASKNLSATSSSLVPAASASRTTGMAPINALMAPALTARSRICIRCWSASRARSSSEFDMIGYDYQPLRVEKVARIVDPDDINNPMRLCEQHLQLFESHNRRDSHN